MIIAMTTSGNDLTAQLDRRFGRSQKFMIYNSESGEFYLKDNTQNLTATQGAGIQAAQNVAATGAEIVITGHCGPKAFKVLSAANIKVYNTKLTTLQEIVTAFTNGELTALAQPDVEGHWV